MIVDVLHHEKGLLLWRVGVGHRRQTDEIDERIVRCRSFAGEEDHLARHSASPRAHDGGRARREKVFAGHHGDENQLLLLGHAWQVDRRHRHGMSAVQMKAGLVLSRWIIGDATFDITQKHKTRLKTDDGGYE